jgi:hypothetical protein
MATGAEFLQEYASRGKKKKKKGSYAPSAASLFNDGGITESRKNFSIATASNKSFKELLDRINSVQSSTVALSALGKKPKDKEREGLLSKLLSQETGILSAPFRAVTAFVADVTNLPFDDAEARSALDEYNPFESAFRSAKGEFAITGGDVFRVNDGDNFGTRLVKWAGAFAFDVSLDPISWVGTLGGPLSRKSIAALAVRDGENMLTPMSKVLSSNGIDSSKVIDKLFQSSPAGQLYDLGHERIVQRLTDQAGGINSALKTKIAGHHFGAFLGANLYRHGRDGVVRGAAELFTSAGATKEVAEKAAKEFLESLPKELGSETGQLLAGGLYLKKPFSGRPIVKLRSANLESNVVNKVANEAFFRASTSSGGQWVSRNFQGKFGKAWAEAKKAMIPGISLKANLAKDDVYRFVDFKDQMAKFNRDVNKFTAVEAAVASSVQAIRQGITDPQKAKYYDEQLKYYYNQASAPVSTNTALAASLTEGVEKRWSQADLSELDAAAKMAADSLRAQLNAARQLKIDAGFKVGNLGEGWVPLMFRDDVYEALRVSGSLKGPEELRYGPGMARIQEAEYISNDELSKLRGFRIDRDITALSPQAANKEIGKVTIGGKEFDGLYEDDPVKVALKYLHEVHNAVTHRRLVDALELTGTVAVLPREVQAILQGAKAASFVSSLGSKVGLTNTIAKRAEEAIANAEKQLIDLVDKSEVERVSRQVMDRISAAEDALKSVDSQIVQATENLRNARRAARMAQPTVPAAQRVLREYGQSGAEQSVEEAQRTARNAASRLSKARRRTEEGIEDLADLSSSPEARLQAQADAAALGAEPGAAGQFPEGALADWQQAQANTSERIAQSASKEEVEAITLAAAKQELEFAKQLRQDILNELGPEQVQRFEMFREALELQVRAAGELEALRAQRRLAVRELAAANADTTLGRAGALQGVVRLYVEFRRRLFDTVAQTGRNIKNMTPEEKLAYDTVKNQHDRAKALLFRVLEHSTRKQAKGAGREYAKSVIDLADKLSVDQFELALVIADAKKLEQFADSLDGVRLSTQMEMVGDMVQSYKTIRDRVSREELANLTINQRSVLEQVNARGFDALLKKELRATEAAKQLFVQDEFMKLGATGGAKIPASMQDVWTTKGIRGVLEDIYKVHGTPTEWENFISRIYDPAALVWRVAATIGRGPAFVLNNTLGGHMNNYLGGVTVAEHALSAKMLSTAVTSVRKIQSKNPNLFPDEMIDLVSKDLEKKLGKIMVGDKSVVDLYIDFFERGGHFDTDTFFHRDQLSKMGLSARRPTRLIGNISNRFTDEPVGRAETSYRRLITFLLDNKVQASFSDLTQASEIYLRFAAFTSGYRRFRNLDSAMDLTYMLHFNYQDLAGAEVWFRRFIPFYTWSRNNIPLQIRATFLSTAQMAKLVKANEEFKNAMAADEDAQWLNDYLPDWMQIQGGFTSYLKFGGNHLALFNKLPMVDVDRMFEVRYIGSVPFPVPRTEEFVSMLGPVGKTTIEWITNRNFEFGYEYTSLGDKVMSTIQTTIPYYGTGKRLASAVGFDVDKERRMSNLYGLLLGTPYGITTITEKSVKGAAFNRKVELSRQAKQAALDAGVDYEWLQDRIKKGDSLRDIHMKILTGQGDATLRAAGKKLSDYEDMISGKKKKKEKDYKAIVSGLARGETVLG